MNTTITILVSVYLIGLAALVLKFWMDKECKRMDKEDRKFEEEIGWL